MPGRIDPRIATAIDHPLYQQPWPEGGFRFFQLGFLVDDVLAAGDRWAAAFGVGPFHVLPPREQRLTRGGRTSAATLQVAVAQAGPVQVELIQQHTAGSGIFDGWLADASSRLHQLCTVTRDYDATTSRYEQAGYPIAGESTGGPFRVAYVDTVADFGFYTEVVEHTDEFVDQVRRIADTCAAWDGTDPVRILTRDGYRVP